MEYFKLNGDVMIPAVGFGVYQIPKEKTQQAVEQALELGYRLIDTAASYFNEAEVGAAIRHSGIPREEIFVTTKLWVQDYEYADALKAFEVSRRSLGLDYLDLYLLHKPYGNYYAAWRAVEKLHHEGLIRAIGVTSFSNERLQDLMLHNEAAPALNQLETNPFFAQEDARQYLSGMGICHQAWSPFAEGKNGIFTHPVLTQIAAAHQRGVGAVILRWLYQRGIGAVAKSVRVERMRENLNIFDFALTAEEMAQINALNTGKSPIYDDQDLAVTKAIGTYKIHA